MVVLVCLLIGLASVDAKWTEPPPRTIVVTFHYSSNYAPAGLLQLPREDVDKIKEMPWLGATFWCHSRGTLDVILEGDFAYDANSSSKVEPRVSCQTSAVINPPVICPCADVVDQVFYSLLKPECKNVSTYLGSAAKGKESRLNVIEDSPSISGCSVLPAKRGDWKTNVMKTPAIRQIVTTFKDDYMKYYLCKMPRALKIPAHAYLVTPKEIGAGKWKIFNFYKPGADLSVACVRDPEQEPNAVNSTCEKGELPADMQFEVNSLQCQPMCGELKNVSQWVTTVNKSTETNGKKFYDLGDVHFRCLFEEKGKKLGGEYRAVCAANVTTTNWLYGDQTEVDKLSKYCENNFAACKKPDLGEAAIDDQESTKLSRYSPGGLEDGWYKQGAKLKVSCEKSGGVEIECSDASKGWDNMGKAEALPCAKDKKKGLTKGAVAGIVVGVLLLIGAVAAAVVLVVLKMRSKRTGKRTGKTQQFSRSSDRKSTVSPSSKERVALSPKAWPAPSSPSQLKSKSPSGSKAKKSGHKHK